MSTLSTRELSRTVNAEARRQFPKLAKLLGMSSLCAVAPRLALRVETPYPYSFTEDDTLLPSSDEAFGRLIRRDRQEGLREIHSRIINQRQEHQWLFIPKESVWIDTTLAADETSVTADQYAHIFLSHIFPAIETVHIHPDMTVRNLAQEGCPNYSKNHLLEAAQPSTNDLIGHCQMTARTAPNTSLVSSIVSHYGVTSLSMNEAATDFGGFRTLAYSRLIGDPSDPAIAIRAALGRMSDHTLRFDGSPAISVEFEPLLIGRDRAGQ